MWPKNFDELLKLVTVVGGIGSFLWSVYVWREKSKKDAEAAIAEQERVADTRRIEASAPFLELQLKLYTEATQVAAVIATSEDAQERKRAIERFWRLHWGELGLVEDAEVEKAMDLMGNALKNQLGKDRLASLSLGLAHACRASLDRSWGIQAWTAGSM